MTNSPFPSSRSTLVPTAVAVQSIYLTSVIGKAAASTTSRSFWASTRNSSARALSARHASTISRAACGDTPRSHRLHAPSAFRRRSPCGAGTSCQVQLPPIRPASAGKSRPSPHCGSAGARTRSARDRSGSGPLRAAAATAHRGLQATSHGGRPASRILHNALVLDPSAGVGERQHECVECSPLQRGTGRPACLLTHIEIERWERRADEPGCAAAGTARRSE